MLSYHSCTVRVVFFCVSPLFPYVISLFLSHSSPPPLPPSSPPPPLPPPAPLTDNVLSKVVSESEVRRVANAIDNCRVQNCTLNQPSSVHNVFVDGKIGIICTVFTTCIAYNEIVVEIISRIIIHVQCLCKNGYCCRHF